MQLAFSPQAKSRKGNGNRIGSTFSDPGGQPGVAAQAEAATGSARNSSSKMLPVLATSVMAGCSSKLPWAIASQMQANANGRLQSDRMK